MYSEGIHDFQRVIIDSRDRISGTSSNFVVTLSSPINRADEIKVISAQIPRSYYSMTNTNLILTTGSTSIAAGNYSMSQLLAALQTASASIPGAPYTFSYSYITGKITISAAGAFGVVAAGALNMARQLGFSVDSPVATSVTGDIVSDISGTRLIIIKSVVLTNFNYRPTVTSSPTGALSGDRTILHTINAYHQLWSSFGDKVNSDSSRVSVNTSTAVFQTIDFSLEDDSGSPLDLNGLEWTIELLFRIR